MRLKSLSLKNYRQYINSQLEFGDGITGIVGLNGSGKSTLIEAIAWTLYGNNAARTGKEGIKRASASLSSNVESELIIEIGGTEYKIVRVLKGSSQTAASSMFANGKMVADSVSGVGKEVAHILGMDWKSFYTSFFAKQKELNALTDLTPAIRRETIIRMLRIDVVERVVAFARQRAKEKKDELELLKKKRSLKDSNVLARELYSLEISRKQHEEKLSAAEDKIKLLESEKDKLTRKFNEERAIYAKHTEIDKERAETEALFKEATEREKELNSDNKNIEKLQKDFILLEESYKEYIALEKEEIRLHNAKEQDIDKKEYRLEQLTEKNDTLDRNKQLLKEGHPCPTCGQNIKNLDKIEEHIMKDQENNNKEILQLEAEIKILRDMGEKEESKPSIKGLKFNAERFFIVRKRKSELAHSHQRYPLIKAELKEKSNITTKLAKARKDKALYSTKKSELTTKLMKINYDPKQREHLTSDYNKIDVDLNKEYSIRTKLKVEIGKTSTEEKNKQKEIDDTVKTEKDIKETALSHEQRDKFIKLVTDYRLHLISQIRPKLAEITGTLLAELTEGKYTLVDIDEEYNLSIYDGNIKYPLQHFSGGEADIANLCLRLAISQYITESSDIETGFIILDEIFGSQDVHRKYSIMNALNRLSKQFRQIILITHVEDIKDSVENIVEVMENEEGASYIKA